MAVRQSSKRMLSLLFAVILLIVTLVVYANYVVPTYAKVNELRAEYAAKQNAVNDQRRILDKVQTLLTRYRSITDLASVVSLALPSSEEVADAFRQVNSIAAANGLSVQQFGVTTALAQRSASRQQAGILKSIGTSQMNVSLIGGYAGLKGFMANLENNIRIMDVKNLKIQPLGSAYLFNLTINAYFQE